MRVVLELTNSLGKQREAFRPVDPECVTVFTCGPSIYQRAHIGNFRTFLYEDLLLRYLAYRGLRTKRVMSVTDIEDKAIAAARAAGVSVQELCDANLEGFRADLELLRMKMPDRLARASAFVEEAADMTARLLAGGFAYRHGRNVYFDPLRYPGFGRLFGLDMSRWPRRRRRFHRDTYPGVQWNMGDFIIWDACAQDSEMCRETELGRGRPAWNIQDASIIEACFGTTLSLLCGGADNLYRHHDYTLAILESLHPRPAARCWLHGAHLLAGRRKMSKSLGNVVYTDDVLREGYDAGAVRFFLAGRHYRRTLSYSAEAMSAAAARLGALRRGAVRLREASVAPGAILDAGLEADFSARMDDDLDLPGAFAVLEGAVGRSAGRGAARAVLASLHRIDEVLGMIF
jgi:cysteinyl-tRNA synthetase